MRIKHSNRNLNEVYGSYGMIQRKNITGKKKESAKALPKELSWLVLKNRKKKSQRGSSRESEGGVRSQEKGQIV